LSSAHRHKNSKGNINTGMRVHAYSELAKPLHESVMASARLRSSHNQYRRPISLSLWPSVKRNVIKRFPRFFLLAVLGCIALFVHLMPAALRTAHHAPFEPPNLDPIVHGRRVSEGQEALYPLYPFPYSPIQLPSDDRSLASADASAFSSFREHGHDRDHDTDATSTHDHSHNHGSGGAAADDEDGRPTPSLSSTSSMATQAAAAHPSTDPPPPWLAAVICAASDVERRMLIRSTWMRLYRDVPFDGRFVVSNPGPRWTDFIRAENSTFGDIVVLDHIQEDSLTSHTIKTLEFFKWLIIHGKRYQFVSKIDTDLWLNARAFWDRFLSPRLSNETGRLEATVQRTVIGELYYSRIHDLVFPHGSMYTVTWDLLELLVSLQDRFRVVAGEDMTLAVLMLKGREEANMVSFRGTEKFDYDDEDSRGDGTAWAREKTHPNAAEHALFGSDVVAVHQLKDKEMWMKVAECFDERGIKEMPPPSGPDRTPSFSQRWNDFWHPMGLSSRYKSRLDDIPDFFWSFENVSWICDGIWNLGRKSAAFYKS
jgi:beta-1,3-galactosyltransferase 1